VPARTDALAWTVGLAAEDARGLARRERWPVVLDLEADPVPVGARGDDGAPARRRELERHRQEVPERARGARPVPGRRREPVGDVHLDRALPLLGGAGEGLHHPPDQRRGRIPGRLELEPPRLDAGEVEQRLDEPVHAAQRALHAHEQGGYAVRPRRRAAALEPLHPEHQRGERVPQVVAERRHVVEQEREAALDVLVRLITHQGRDARPVEVLPTTAPQRDGPAARPTR